MLRAWLVFVGLELSYFRLQILHKWIHLLWSKGRTIDKIKLPAQVTIDTVQESLS